DQHSALPDEIVLHQMQASEDNRSHQDAREHPDRIHQDGLNESTEKQFLDNWTERDSEQSDRDAAHRIVHQLVEWSFHLGNPEQAAQKYHDESQTNTCRYQMGCLEWSRNPSQRLKQRLAMARKKYTQDNKDNRVPDELGGEKRDSRLGIRMKVVRRRPNR